MLDILQDYLHLRRYAYQRLDGSLRSEERDMAIKNFQQADGEDFVFLLSTRAGGVGLNLVAASVVIFFDSDWNPQMDRQAEARVHRIGQDKDVLVIRLVSRSTIEDVIQKRAKKKLMITEAVIEEGQFSSAAQTGEKQTEGEGDEDLGFMRSVIKFGIRDICGSNAEEPPVTAADIQRILHPDDAVDQHSAVRGQMERAATLIALPSDSEDEAEVLDSMDIDSEEEDDFLATPEAAQLAVADMDVDPVMARIAADYTTSPTVRAVGEKRMRRRPTSLSPVDTEEFVAKRARVTEEQKKKRAAKAEQRRMEQRAAKKTLWATNGYHSLALPPAAEDDQGGTNETSLLVYAKGNVFQPTRSGARIIVMYVTLTPPRCV